MTKPEALAKEIFAACKEKLQSPLAHTDAHTLHNALGEAVMQAMLPRWNQCRKAHIANRRACYFSMEFLMGRAVYNNLYCLGILEDVAAEFEKEGVSLSVFEDIEDAALGNGGLGRLAACFLDSAATCALPLDGYGIRYRYGLFKQSFTDGRQTETGDDWTRFGDCWSMRRDDEAVLVNYANQTVRAVPYDMPIFGYPQPGCEPHIGTLRLWQAEPVNAFDFHTFNDQHYLQAAAETVAAEDISRCLYPNDDTREGKALRLKQQYFFCAASLADALKKHKAQYGTLDTLPEKLAVQLNDTHPVISIPELIRLLMLEGYDFFRALDMAKHIFAYTNHTIMQEALEKWDCDLMDELVPEVYAIVLQISEAFLQELYAKELPEETIQSLRIVKNGQVHMANLAMYAGAYVNGVAEIHTELLKTTVLSDWYDLMPEKFQNKTNGITQRRWLGVCNPELCDLLEELSGSRAFLTDLEQLASLSHLAEDPAVMQRFLAVKQTKKQQLADFIRKQEGIVIDPNSCFDVQIKRLHEYKRQLLNAFSILWIYFGIKDGSIKDFKPTTFLFGAKSAPGYRRAKAIIKFINEIAKLIANDPAVSDLIKVVFVTNYNVSYAEKLVAACDISEQISTAGTEASGTGNMKMMLNGAVTLGTMDGANIEIVAAAGKENNYIFGATVEEITEIMPQYCSRKVFAKDERIARVVRTLIDGTVSDGGSGEFRELYFALLDGASWHQPDHYYLLGDLPSYVETKLQAINDSAHREAFAAKQWRNTCAAGPFSSDRTIRQYAAECWHIDPIAD
ncbi:MAG: glycogen/starch/alpha-glucan family phosphorylase [Oscillospiraceae bacterium]|nr:glycogen/starch/alpha-glucan family phosphorylase [Oscillospiraceae bacterium]